MFNERSSSSLFSNLSSSNSSSFLLLFDSRVFCSLSKYSFLASLAFLILSPASSSLRTMCLLPSVAASVTVSASASSWSSSESTGLSSAKAFFCVESLRAVPVLASQQDETTILFNSTGLIVNANMEKLDGLTPFIADLPPANSTTKCTVDLALQPIGPTMARSGKTAITFEPRVQWYFITDCIISYFLGLAVP